MHSLVRLVYILIQSNIFYVGNAHYLKNTYEVLIYMLILFSTILKYIFVNITQIRWILLHFLINFWFKKSYFHTHNYYLSTCRSAKFQWTNSDKKKLFQIMSKTVFFIFLETTEQEIREMLIMKMKTIAALDIEVVCL